MGELLEVLKPVKPCPFCGTKCPEVYLDDEGTFTVECQECGGMFVSPTSKDRAAAGWNNRQVEQQLIAACEEALCYINAVSISHPAAESEAEVLRAAIAKATGETNGYH